VNIYEAFKSGRPVRRKGNPVTTGSNGSGWIDPDHFLRNYVTIADVQALDWEVQEPQVAVMRSQFFAAVEKVRERLDIRAYYVDPSELALELGLEPNE
jgi:hypothetical protein